MTELKSGKGGGGAGEAGALSVDELFDLQSRHHIKGTVEPVGDDGQLVKVTPWFPFSGCLCQLALVVPKAVIDKVKPTGESHQCCGKTLQVVEITFKEDGTMPVKQVFEQISQGGTKAAAFAPAPRTARAHHGLAPSGGGLTAGAPRPPQSTCICDHFIKRFCADGQLYEEYWCYDETGAFCGSQVVPLGLSCPTFASPRLRPDAALTPRTLSSHAELRGAVGDYGGGFPSRGLAGAATRRADQWSGYITLLADDGNSITFHVGCFGDGPYTVSKSQIVSINQVGICGNYGAYYAVINF
jgi:hypothetical protein